MSKAKVILYNILLFVIAAAFGIGFWAIGLVTSDNTDLWNIVFAVLLGTIGLLCVINIVSSVMISRKYSKMKMRELYEHFNDIRVKAQGDISGARKKTMRVVVLAYIYLALIFVLVCGCAFAAGKANYGLDGSIILLLLLVYLLAGVFDILLLPLANDLTQLEVELADNDFPLIRKTAERASAAVGYNGKIKLFLVGSGVSVNAYRGTAYITIGYKEAALFTSSELYAVMLHEFAHIVNADVSSANRLVRIQERWDGHALSKSMTFLVRLLLFKCVANVLGFNVELYKIFSSINKERAADELVRRLDGNGSFADAIAKTEMIVKYGKMPIPETEYYFFEPETPTPNYATIDYNTYLKYCKKYGEIWRDELKNELPSRIDTHPTSRMRIQSFGLDVQDCNDSATEEDPMYVVEQQRIIERADAYIDKLCRVNYAEQREQDYVQRKAAIDSLDSAEADGGYLNGAARERALWALHGIDDDRALILADKMIAENDHVPAANFVKGYIYKRRHDDRCVECFKIATEYSGYAEDAYANIGEYALLTGNEELIEEYRANVPDVMQTAQDKRKDNEFKKNTPTEPCDLDIAVVAELATKINGVSGDSVKKIYVSKYTAPDGIVHYPFAFDLTKKAAMRSNNDFSIYYSTYDIIQSYNDEPSFILCNPHIGLMRNVKRANGVLVYDCVKQMQVEK